MSKPGYSSSTISLQPALRMILWEPYRKLSTKEKEKHYSAKIMTFSHFPLPLDENHIHLLSTTALRWSTDKKRIPKRKVGTIHSRESHRKPKWRQCWKEGNICSAWTPERFDFLPGFNKCCTPRHPRDCCGLSKPINFLPQNASGTSKCRLRASTHLRRRESWQSTAAQALHQEHSPKNSHQQQRQGEDLPLQSWEGAEGRANEKMPCVIGPRNINMKLPLVKLARNKFPKGEFKAESFSLTCIS